MLYKINYCFAQYTVINKDITYSCINSIWPQTDFTLGSPTIREMFLRASKMMREDSGGRKHKAYLLTNVVCQQQLPLSICSCQNPSATKWKILCQIFSQVRTRSRFPALLFTHLLADMRCTPRQKVFTEAFKWMSSAFCVSLCLLSVSVIYVSKTNKFPQSQAPCSVAEPIIFATLWPNQPRTNNVWIIVLHHDS